MKTRRAAYDVTTATLTRNQHDGKFYVLGAFDRVIGRFDNEADAQLYLAEVNATAAAQREALKQNAQALLNATPRVRPDGSETFTTLEHDARWYWPVGTRVALCVERVPMHAVVVKRNAVSVSAQLSDGRVVKTHVKHIARVEGPCACAACTSSVAKARTL